MENHTYQINDCSICHNCIMQEDIDSTRFMQTFGYKNAFHTPIWILNCKHAFHGECIIRWGQYQIQQNSRVSGPYCREPVVKIETITHSNYDRPCIMNISENFWW